MQVLGMRLIRKAHLAPGVHECAYMSFKPSERDGTWIELLLADPAQVCTTIPKSLSSAASAPVPTCKALAQLFCVCTSANLRAQYLHLCHLLNPWVNPLASATCLESIAPHLWLALLLTACLW